MELREPHALSMDLTRMKWNPSWIVAAERTAGELLHPCEGHYEKGSLLMQVWRSPG